MNIENDIKVSVCVVAYNQENYIAECLESLVKQVTSFKFEIIVGEDCSTDGTRAIVQKKLQRIRPPRVQLTYDVEVGDGKEIKLLPFWIQWALSVPWAIFHILVITLQAFT